MAFFEIEEHHTERFSLLLLEPGEIYFEDFSVYYYPTSKTVEESVKRKQRGHLKVCSKSLVFVPSEKQYPILRFPSKNVKSVEEYHGNLQSRIDGKDRCLKFTTDIHIEMKKDNIVSPYIFRKILDNHVFSLNYVTVEDCLPIMGQLHRAATLQPVDQDSMIMAIVQSRQARLKFNASWLDSLYEKFEIECQVSKITPLVTNPGRAMVTSCRLYFQPFNNLEASPLIKIKLKDIKSIAKRRFLLKQIGLEIVCADTCRPSHLYLAFKSQVERDMLYEQLCKQPDVSIEVSDQHDITLKWQNGIVSNFDYLMYLNSVSDRSFFDLTQYPVMPWVVQDFTSSILDLNNPETFRDLTKPVGALNEDRLARMKERYNEMPPPKFLYGSHYSTPGYVLFYLARVAPEYVLCLQNGKFDHPDRMFNSVLDMWQNCLQGAADFKELVPEFYSGNGEYLIHSGVCNFGVRQDGRPVGNVELPPWAKDPQDFIKKMRAALECEYVSKHLHDWIDLIFGYKQTGPEAEKADNVFYYMTYEGAVDLDSIKDPNERACMEIQIMEFGQVPKQLFTTPHPMRYGSSMFPLRALCPEFTQSFVVVSNESEAHLADSDEAAFEVDFTTLREVTRYSLHKDTITDVKLSLETKVAYSVSKDCLLKLYSLEDQNQLRSVSLTHMTLSSVLVTPDNATVICGSWDDNVYFYSIEYGHIMDTLRAHDDAVSCICWKNNILITASWDSSVKLWKFEFPTSFHSFTPAKFMMQLDHEYGVWAVAVDDNCHNVVSATQDGKVYIWDIEAQYLKSVFQVHEGKINSVLISKDKHRIITCGDDRYLRVLDFESGTEIFVKDIKEVIHCLAIQGIYLLLGTSSGNIQVWDMEKVVQLHQFTAHTGAVTCMHITDDYSLLSGSADKSVCLWRLR